MRKIVITYGLISGAIITSLFLISMYLWSKGIINFDNGEYFGYGSMLVALSMVFFGIKSFRDNQNGKKIGFWKGVLVGFLITLLASFVYASSWEVYMQVSPSNKFVEEYSAHYVEQLKQKGTPQAEIDKTMAEMASMMEMYKNPFIRFGMTLMEILPVGIIVTLLSAAILRKKEILAP
jgi:magnesium-transporting ATPase (P-type)